MSDFIGYNSQSLLINSFVPYFQTSSDEDEPPRRKRCQSHIGTYFSPRGVEKKTLSSITGRPTDDSLSRKRPSGSQYRKKARKIVEDVSKLQNITNFKSASLPSETVDQPSASSFSVSDTSEFTQQTPSKTCDMPTTDDILIEANETVDQPSASSFSVSGTSEFTQQIPSQTCDMPTRPTDDILIEDQPSFSQDAPCSVSTAIPSSVTSDINVSTIPIISTNETQISSSSQESSPHEIYPTDRANFPVNITDPELKRSILRQGPCKPTGPFPKDGNKRSFSTSLYFKTNETTNQVIPRQWLCYSQKLDSVYCEHCWLFAERDSTYFRSAWVTGIKDWQGLSKKIKAHESSEVHMKACVTYDCWKNGLTLSKVADEMSKREVSYWTSVLTRVTDVTLTLASCNLAFRGHREKIGAPNNGNFLSIIELLSRYDPVLNELLTKRESKLTYLSYKIQNELIELLASAVHKNIIDDITNAQFFSVITDTTQDITKVDQLSQIFRYVDVEKNDKDEPVNIVIRESFVGFTDVTDHSAASLTEKTVKMVEDRGLKLTNCRGQGYDGASVMSGIYTGVQARISALEPNAVYVHCAAHNLNLVLNDACDGIPAIKAFYDIVQKIYVFFSASNVRWSILECHISSSWNNKPDKPISHGSRVTTKI